MNTAQVTNQTGMCAHWKQTLRTPQDTCSNRTDGLLRGWDLKKQVRTEASKIGVLCCQDKYILLFCLHFSTVTWFLLFQKKQIASFPRNLTETK